ncbi:oligosaccharide flippase family protein [soil metagenome]
MKPADKTRSILQNTSVLMLAQVSSLAVSILLTPFIVRTLGIERYGLWIFLGAIVAFAGLFQVGTGRGSIRFIAFYSERGDLNVARRIVAYGVLAHLASGALLIPLAWFLGRAAIPHVGIAADLQHTAETLFPLVVALFVFVGALRPFSALLIGLDRMWVTSIAMLVSQLVYAVAIIGLLGSGAGLYGLLAATFVQVALQGAICMAVGHSLIGRVLGNPFALDRAVVGEMIRFGGWTQIVGLASLVNRQTDAIVIGVWVGLGSAGLYDLGNKIAQLTRTLPLSILGPLLPATAGMHAQGADRALARAVLQASRLLALLTIGMAGFVLATAPLIMAVWLGKTYPHVVAISAILVATYVVNNLTGVGTTVVSAIGKPRYESEYAVLGMTLNLGATLALVPFFGLYGVLAGTLIGVVLCSLYFIWRFHRVMHYPLWTYVGSWLSRLAAGATLAGASIAGIRVLLPASVVDDRWEAALTLVGLGAVYSVLLLVFLRLFRFLVARDLATLRRVMPRRLEPLTHLWAVEFVFGARS